MLKFHPQFLKNKIVGIFVNYVVNFELDRHSLDIV